MAVVSVQSHLDLTESAFGEKAATLKHKKELVTVLLCQKEKAFKAWKSKLTSTAVESSALRTVANRTFIFQISKNNL